MTSSGNSTPDTQSSHAKVSSVVLIASPGGHLTQVLDITSKIDAYKIIVTTSDNAVTPVGWNGCTRMFRNTRYNVFVHFLNLLKSFSLLNEFKPGLIMSTGGPFVLTMFIAARVMNIKCVYVDTASRISAPSATAKMLTRLGVATEIIVQWPHLTKVLKGAKYYGSIFNLSDDGHA